MQSRQSVLRTVRGDWRGRFHAWGQAVSRLLDDGKQKSSIKVLDGVRAVACLSVLFFHMNYDAREYHLWVPIHQFGALGGALALSGQSGVTLFFILSGFLLFLPYAKALLFESNWPSLWQFYLRRIFRIVPAYYVVLFVMILLFSREYLQPDHWQNLWLFLTFRQDLPATYQQIDGPFWTLAVEFQFYILLPLLAWVMGLIVCRGRVGWRMCKLTLCLGALIVWGVLSLYWGYVWLPRGTLHAVIPSAVIDALQPYIFGGSGKSLEVFAVGMLACMVYVYLQNTPEDSRWNKRVRAFSLPLFVLGLAFFCFMALWHFYTWYFNYTLHVFDPYRELLVHSWDEWQGLLYALSYGLCMFALLYVPPRVKRPFEWPLMRWIGWISFSLYMWHDPLIHFFMQTVVAPINHAGVSHLLLYGLLGLWVLLVIIPLSLASYLFIEKPGIQLGEKLRRKLVARGEKGRAVPQAAGPAPRITATLAQPGGETVSDGPRVESTASRTHPL